VFTPSTLPAKTVAIQARRASDGGQQVKLASASGLVFLRERIRLRQQSSGERRADRLPPRLPDGPFLVWVGALGPYPENLTERSNFDPPQLPREGEGNLAALTLLGRRISDHS